MSELILIAILAFLGWMLVTYLTRGTTVQGLRSLPPDSQSPSARDASLKKALTLLTGTQMERGNQVRLLLNGDGTYGPFLEALGGARTTICLHVFIFQPGELAERLAEVLEARARAGVNVLLLLDAFGAWGLGKGYRDRLEAAGVEIALFRPLRIRTLYKVQQRMHVRAVVIDGRVGFTGGFGIDDRWLGDGRSGGWRDTNVRVEGPVVGQLQVAFVANWAEATGDLLVGPDLFPDLGPADEGEGGIVDAGMMHCRPSLGVTHAEKFFFLMLAGARERLWVTNAYFVPDRGFRRMLMDAARRGVDVRILTPGRNTDRCSAWYAARGHYPELVEAGVRIYDYTPGMVHAKTIVVDSTWATVGTFNFDNRSMQLNDEVALLIRDGAVVEELEAIFRADLEHAREHTLEALARRGDRWKEQLSRLVAPLL